ncbi:MAG: Rpn family recombination-promoting nuclease/putative transposase [Eubacterium sp.]|nr:Rpn family recombination-promoting nuclease/putative transposase [Eubacterium sp.]
MGDKAPKTAITPDKTYNFKPLEELTLMDDYMFSAVMRDTANLKPLLEYILGIRISEIAYVEPQKSEKEGYRSHGIILDLYVKDADGIIYNVEVQAAGKKNLPKRTRYYQSVIDINVLAPGVDYRKLSRSYVLFICNYDPFNRKRYIYTFENRCIEEPDLSLGDDTRKVIVNTTGTVGNISNELRELIIYLEKGIATGDYTRQLDKAVKLIKVSEMRRHEYMVMMIHDMEIREEGREEGKIFGTIETMQDDGKDEETIRNRLIDKYHLEDSEAVEYILKANGRI